MTTPTLKLYAFPLALLMLSVGAAAPQANAETRPGEVRAVEARFVYKRNAPAAEIYADFQQTAKAACKSPLPRSTFARRQDALCARDLLDKVLNHVGRADLAAMHAGEARG